MQLGQLFSGNRCRCLGERTDSLLGFRKGYDFANGVGVAEDHHQSIHAKGNPAMGWSTELEGTQQKTELVIGLLPVNAQGVQYAFLDLGAVNTDGAAADFIAV